MSFDGVKDKLGDINAQEKVNEVKDKLNVIKNNGIQNKFGFISTSFSLDFHSKYC